MTFDATVVTGTFGASWWGELANERARRSVPEGVPFVHTHAATLAQARNVALESVETEWVVNLDADDELEPGYMEALAAGTADLRAPSVRYVQDGRSARPRVPKVAGHRHPCSAECLDQGNWLVIGTAVRADLARDIGWREWPVYEDWDFFWRCHLAGATVEAVPDAVYRAHVRFDSRNRAPDMAVKNDVHRQIVDANREAWAA